MTQAVPPLRSSVRSGQWQSWLAAAAALFLVVGGAACSDDGDETSASETTAATRTTAPESSSTTNADGTAEVLAAYRSAWDAQGVALKNAAGEVPPELLATTTGAALENLLQTRGELAEQGQYIDGPVELNPEVASLDGSTALVVDCAVDHAVRYGAAGEVVGPADETPYTYRTTLVIEDGTWKVNSVELEDECQP